MSRRRSHALLAVLVVLGLTGCVVVRSDQPRRTTTSPPPPGATRHVYVRQNRDRPVYVVVHDHRDNPPPSSGQGPPSTGGQPAPGSGSGPPLHRTNPVVRDDPPPHAPAHGRRREFAFTYYPSARVYYAPDQQRYFWFKGGKWTVGARLPATITVSESEACTVVLDTEVPYSRHAEVEAAIRRDRSKGQGKGWGPGTSKPKHKGKGKGHYGDDDGDDDDGGSSKKSKGKSKSDDDGDDDD